MGPETLKWCRGAKGEILRVAQLSCVGTDLGRIHPFPLLSHSVCRNGRLQCTQVKLIGQSKWMRTVYAHQSESCFPSLLTWYPDFTLS